MKYMLGLFDSLREANKQLARGKQEETLSDEFTASI